MKTAPTNLKNWLAARQSGDASAWRCDLYTLTLVDGTTHFHWTSNDTNLTVSGSIYYASGTANAPTIKRGPYRQSSNLSIDTLDIELGGTFSVGGIPLVALAARGYLDGARVRIDHAIGPTPGDLSLGVIPSWFEGPVSTVEPSGLNVTMRLKSQLEAMNVYLPKFLIQPQCGNAVYDANCGLSRVAYTIAGVTTTGGTVDYVVTSSAAILAKSSFYFNLGVLTITSGAESGQIRSIESFLNSTTYATFKLAQPLSTALGSGIGFDAYPGCDRSLSTCGYRFSNTSHWRGFPLVPRPEAA